MKAKNYMAPTLKVVDFTVEHGFAGSPNYSVNQPGTDNDGMVEQMNYQTDAEQTAWDWRIR